MNALDYLLKANLYGLLFASCYWFFLRRHTFFTLNRVYLLMSAVLSLVLPLASLPAQTVETLPTDWPVPVGVITLPVATVATATAQLGQASTAPDWEQIAMIAYGLIALLFVLRLAVRVGRLCWLIQRSERQVQANHVLVINLSGQASDSDAPTFSFFRYLVLNPADKHNSLIIRHELVHIRQYHSADVLGLALLRALFWACPALWFIDKMLRQVHEFLADKEASQPTEYARFLLDYTFGLQPDALTNGFFNPPLLKQRIQMLYQTATPRWALGKYMLVLPLMLSLLAMTTARKEIKTLIRQATEDTITITGRIKSAVSGKPLAGSIVLINGTRKGTQTNAKGFFTLINVPKNATLSVSFVGFQTMTIPVDGRTAISASLALTDPNELPTMGATAAYRAVKPNPAMPIRTPPSVDTINGEVYRAVEERAVFPTGIPGLMQYVAHALRYPVKARTNGIEGTVLVSFVVLPTGAIGSASVKRGIGGGCDAEALRIVKHMPYWLPAKQNGQAVATQHVLPIQFSLEKKVEDRRTGLVMPESKASSERPRVYYVDNSKNARFALYNDVQTNKTPWRYLPDSLRKSSSRVTIRSNGFSIGDPLYIVDGVEAKNGIGYLDQKDIDNATVLKGESAASYGEKGKNGVVLITTKKK
ncbi:hypothetical protein GCM10028818_23370 [Spirosoma horti]